MTFQNATTIAKGILSESGFEASDQLVTSVANEIYAASLTNSEDLDERLIQSEIPFKREYRHREGLVHAEISSRQRVVLCRGEFDSATEANEWLAKAAVQFYPESEFATAMEGYVVNAVKSEMPVIPMCHARAEQIVGRMVESFTASEIGETPKSLSDLSLSDMVVANAIVRAMPWKKTATGQQMLVSVDDRIIAAMYASEKCVANGVVYRSAAHTEVSVDVIGVRRPSLQRA